jgi:putative transposase
MTAPLSQDLRERIVRAVADGSSIRQAAERFQVSASAAIKLMQRVRQTGRTAPAQIGGDPRPLLEPYAAWLRALVSDRKGITLREIQAALAEILVSEKVYGALSGEKPQADRTTLDLKGKAELLTAFILR